MNWQNYMPWRLTPEQVAVVSSGIVSMGLEILAGRVLAPAYGSTIYTWGSIIGISMLALSIGYHHGGKTSKNVIKRDLDRFLVMTAVYILFLVYAGDAIITASSSLPIGPRYAVLVPVAVLFGPPTYFLGYISPYAVQLSPKEDKGEASGHFYAVGTAGSILGAFGTTFVLIPNLAVDHIYLIFAALAILPVLNGIRDRKILPFMGMLAVGWVLAGAAPVSGSTIHEESTPYQELRVTQQDNVRTLYLDGTPQSAVYTDDTEGYVWEYLNYFELPFLMRDNIDQVLFIGGGGFVGPQAFADRNISVHAVELDPVVIDVAKEWFNLSESDHLTVHEGDGRQFLQQTNETFDVIYLDAYRKSQVPFHLTTKEFMEEVSAQMDEQGIVVSNTIATARGPGSRFARAQYKTMGSVFNTTYYYPTAETEFAQNIELLGTKNGTRLSSSDLNRRDTEYTHRDLTPIIKPSLDVRTENVPVLTDDYAPVDTLLDPLIGRRYAPGS
ncbi:MAG: fused MFS/spermidine synthase [Candidatus Nanohaloarchaeota archaeon QJJ-5]|nr:fused MFS/spermidine synthase [Candidatus Nanohaloarchaeota archaeon QJJ-5]